MLQHNENHQLLAAFQKALQTRKDANATLQAKKKEYESIQTKKEALLDVMAIQNTKDVQDEQVTCNDDAYTDSKFDSMHILSDSFAVQNIGTEPTSIENKLVTKFYNAKRIFYSVKGNHLTMYTLKTNSKYEMTIEAENETYKGEKGWLQICMTFNKKFELKSIYDFFGFTDANVKSKIEEMYKQE